MTMGSPKIICCSCGEEAIGFSPPLCGACRVIFGQDDAERLYDACRHECKDGECQLAVANGGRCPLELVR
jgi:hypothetical protein